MVKNLLPLLIVLSVSIYVALGFLRPGFVPTHDLEYHLIRLWQFDKVITAGNLFPRWAPDLNSGFGIPLFNFFYPLPNYISEFFHFLLGFSYIDSLKYTLALGMVASGVFFYLWINSLWGKWPGVVGAVFYILAPYHLVDLYIRGTPGEIWALAFLPAVLWAIEQKKPVWGGVFLALLILVHNILAIIFFLFIISYAGFVCLREKKKKYFLLSIFYSIVLGLALSAFFWLPALAEAKYVFGLKIGDYTEHFPELFQLIFPSWGAGFSIPGIMDQMSFQIGLPHLLAVLLSLVFRRQNIYLGFLLIWLVIICFLLLEVSLPIWRLIPGSDLIQYPWRLLSLVILITSALAAGLIFSTKSKIMAVFLIVIAIMFYGSYTQPVTYAQRKDSFYLDNPDWITGTATLGNSFSTVWLTSVPTSKKQKLEIISGKVKIENEKIQPEAYFFTVTADTSSVLRVNTAYFPGWKVWVNKKEKSINFSDGLINFDIPVGKNLIQVKFTNTPIRIIASIISCVGLFSIVTLASVIKKLNKL